LHRAAAAFTLSILPDLSLTFSRAESHMLSRKLLVLTVVGGFLAVPSARADVKPHPLFTDNAVLQRDVEIPVWGLAEPGEKVTVELSRKETASASAVADKDGKWMVKLPKHPAGTGFKLKFTGKNVVDLQNVAIGEVWIGSGQSNMEWSINASLDPDKVKAAAANPNLRLLTVQKRTAASPIDDQNDLKHFTKWAAASPENVGGFSAVLYHFGSNLQKNLPMNMPVGLIHTSWGGTPAQAWASTEALQAQPDLKGYGDAAASAKAALEKQIKEFDTDKAKAAYEAALAKWTVAAEKAKEEKKPIPQKPTLQQKPSSVGPGTPASLYNAMIHPLLPYAIKGAIWYQGESNAGQAYQYRNLFATMIKDWRAKWGYDFPFYLVQLAPFNSGNPDAPTWAELREAQYLATVKLPKVGMAVITDVGHPTDIHPKDKLTVGTRLALAARAQTYGEKIEFSGPIYKALKVEGDKAVLTFDHVGGGLVVKGEELTGFTVAGEDKMFHPAKAVITADTVVVTSDKVTKPVAVRFAWKNFPVVNFFNKDGLPAGPFRTDDFPLTTGGPAAPKK